MPSRTMPGIGLQADWDLGEDGWKPGMDANLLTLSVLAGQQVLEIVAAEPGAPAEGDIVILDETNATHPNEIAVYDEAGWHYIVPITGVAMLNLDDGLRYEFDGAEWSVLVAGIGEAPIDGTKYVRKDGAWVAESVGGGGSGSAWSLQWGPLDNEAPAANYATIDTRNGRPILTFVDGLDKDAIFSGALPADYSGAGITVHIYWASSSGGGGNVVWNVAVERTDLSGLDIDADSFAAAGVATTTVPGTSGMVVQSTINFASGAAMDSLAAGELFRLKVTRNGDDAADTLGDAAQLVRVVMVSQ